MPPLTTILHLTDLHLGGAQPGEILDDYSKADFVSREERTSRRRVLEATLTRLAEERDGAPYDAVVISGDITVGGEEDGYAELEAVLATLGSARPPAERVVVVPGNHDVRWKTAPGSGERYALFGRYVVGAGYVVPMLGHDDALDAQRQLLVDRQGGYVIVPLNSSNWCGVVAGLKPQVQDELDAALSGVRGADTVRGIVEELRLFDVPRIAQAHIEKLRRALRDVDPDRKLVRIAVVHHQILPVSPREELKPFESIINLELLRGFFRDNGFALVLHGHKHEGRTYYDHIAADEQAAPAVRPVLIVSGSTAGGAPGRLDDVARVLDLHGGPLAPQVRVGRIRGVVAGAALSAPAQTPWPLWSVPAFERAQRPEPNVISGRTVHETYARLTQTGERSGPQEPLTNIVSHVEEARVELPDTYPEEPLDGRDPAEWILDVVAWWQAAGRLRGHGSVLFSHGDRIRNYANGTDQLKNAEQILREDRGFNGRATISLLDPRIDDVRRADHKYPAFVAAQFIKRPLTAGRYRIDVVGYFRKQELRYWWPVNVAELAWLQKELAARLGDSYETGSVSTFTAIGYASAIPPRVAVPRVEQLHEVYNERLFLLAFGLAGEGPLDRDEVDSEWKEILDTIVPPQTRPEADPPIALDGLLGLSADLTKVAVATGSEHCKTIAAELERLYAQNHKFAQEYARLGPAADYDTWRGAVQGYVTTIRNCVNSCLT